MLTQPQLQDILDTVMQDTTSRMTSIQMSSRAFPLSEDICTVCTTFEGTHHATVSLCADTSLLMRLTRDVIQADTVTSQDVEDFAKEYFNVICGQVVARLFQLTHAAFRFQIPDFYVGKYLPDESSHCCVLSYRSSSNEGVQLVVSNLSLPMQSAVYEGY